MNEILKEIMDKHPAAPFLFIGSGFSRRYLKLEDWGGLLQRFCGPIREFGYYSAKADGSMPLAASYMADDFNEWWWSAPETEVSRSEFANVVKGRSDALKVEICRYIRNFSLEDARKSECGNEIAALSEISVDGIITTNWDFLLEELFPDYRVFVGQEELLFANPQAIGEIYKIHGSADSPRSLVVTDEDYLEFADKNPYLAAKLVTIFVEHPIVFIGYSITDPHIKAIIMSIAKCLTQDKIAAFQENLIFVQRAAEGQDPAIEKTTIQSSEFSVTMTVAKISDFSQVYLALGGTKRKIPVRLLRFFKEQMYELVHASADIDKKIAVVDYEDIESAEEVEFVVGVGVARSQAALGEKVTQHVQEALAKKGYEGISAEEVFTDCLLNDPKFQATDLLESAFPSYGRSNRTFIPVFRYLQSAGITSQQQLDESKYEGAKKVVKKLVGADYTLPSYAARYKKEFFGLTTKEIIEKAASPTEAVLMLAHQPAPEVDLGTLASFLRENSQVAEKAPYKTAYRKLVCRYDRLAFGF